MISDLNPIFYISSMYGITFIPLHKNYYVNKLQLLLFVPFILLNILSFGSCIFDFYNTNYIKLNRALQATKFLLLVISFINIIFKTSYYILKQNEVSKFFNDLRKLKSQSNIKHNNTLVKRKFSRKIGIKAKCFIILFLQLINFIIENIVFYNLTKKLFATFYITYWTTLHQGRVEYVIISEALDKIIECIELQNKKFKHSVKNANVDTTKVYKNTHPFTILKSVCCINRVNDLYNIHHSARKISKNLINLFGLPLSFLICANLALIVMCVTYFVKCLQTLVKGNDDFTPLTLLAFYWMITLYLHLGLICYQWIKLTRVVVMRGV